MWKQFLNLLQTVLTLSKDVEQYRAEIRGVREDLLKLTLSLHDLKNEIALIDQRETGERERLILRLNNILLEFEKKMDIQAPGRLLEKKSKKAAGKKSKP